MRLVMVVDDPDAAFARAVKAGAKVVSAVADQPYGWRVGRVVDPFGHHWEIGKPLDETWGQTDVPQVLIRENESRIHLPTISIR